MWFRKKKKVIEELKVEEPIPEPVIVYGDLTSIDTLVRKIIDDFCNEVGVGTYECVLIDGSLSYGSLSNPRSHPYWQYQKISGNSSIFITLPFWNGYNVDAMSIKLIDATDPAKDISVKIYGDESRGPGLVTGPTDPNQLRIMNRVTAISKVIYQNKCSIIENQLKSDFEFLKGE